MLTSCFVTYETSSKIFNILFFCCVVLIRLVIHSNEDISNQTSLIYISSPELVDPMCVIPKYISVRI